jgi:APA family basic amino acid/polyamine antiporter
MQQLKKALTVRGLTMIAIGASIGSGIFVSPASTMAQVPHHGYALLAWLLGGIAAFFGAITFSELGSAFPNEGGVYVYLKEAYGKKAAFLYGWVILLIINTGALAALGLALADYLTFFVLLSDWQRALVAITVIWGLTGINALGVQISQQFAVVFTGLKLFAMLLIIGVGFWHFPSISHDVQLNPFSAIPEGLLGGILLAFVGVFWSMGGWHHATYMSGEAIDASRTVPRAMLWGTLVITLVYLAIIGAYMVLLPADAIAASQRVAGDAIESVVHGGGRFVSIAIAVSIFGTIGIYTMTAPRIYFAMARDGLFFDFLADISPRFQTPVKAMFFQAMWATLLIFIWGSFVRMITFVTFMDIVFMSLACCAVFIFRRRGLESDGYKMAFYPWPPLIYLLICLSFVIYTLLSFNKESWAGMAILLAGLPVYAYFGKKQKTKTR